MRSLMAAVLVAASSLGLGCFSKPQPDCAFLCGAGDACPDGYFCAGDGVCKRDGLAETFDCGFVAPIDAGPPPDAPPDASADAGVDAS